MANVIGVRFRSGSKMYFFDPGEGKYSLEEKVIVETSRGEECGRVVMAEREIEDRFVSQPLRSVVRAATEDDLAREAGNREKEKDAYRICREKIAERGLDMKLIRAEYTFDSKKLLFYFTADGRIDFRDLVKDLASVFRMRIELRQIGVRDEAKMLGGIGICGRPFCCSTFLSDFAPVSIKMAKEQNLSLNPTKISGSCGRLMCCLKNEQETYEYLLKKMPGIGDIVEGPEGERGKVFNINVLRQTCRVIIELDEDNKEMREYPVDDLEVLFSKRRNKGKSAPKDIHELESKGRARRAKAEREAAEDLFAAEAAEAADVEDRPEKSDHGRGSREKDGREGRSRGRDGRNRDRRGQDAGKEENREKENRGQDKKEGGERSRRRRRAEQASGEAKENRPAGRAREGQSGAENADRRAESSGEGGSAQPEKKRRRRSRGRRRHGGEGGQQGENTGAAVKTPASPDHD